MRRQINQRKAAERALNDQFEFMRSLVNGTPHPIYVRDRQGLLQSCNDSFASLQCKTRRRHWQKCHSRHYEQRLRSPEYQADYQRVVAEGTP
jgi:two-component system sensor histidine kinase EvgS